MFKTRSGALKSSDNHAYDTRGRAPNSMEIKLLNLLIENLKLELKNIHICMYVVKNCVARVVRLLYPREFIDVVW